MLAAGDRVRCVWSGKVGRVLEAAAPAARSPGDDSPAGVLVLLDPFSARWAGEDATRTDSRPLAGLEVIYAPEDIEEVHRVAGRAGLGLDPEPPRSRR